MNIFFKLEMIRHKFRIRPRIASTHFTSNQHVSFYKGITVVYKIRKYLREVYHEKNLVINNQIWINEPPFWT